MKTPDQNKRLITAKDVAKLADVSIATVSRVINNDKNVSKKTRDKVLDAIQILRYQPSRTAQRLRAKRSQLIGLIISDIENPFFTSVVRGIEDVAYKSDYSIVLCNSDENIEKEKLYIDVMFSESMAGVIITSTADNKQILQHLIDHNIGIVAIDRTIQVNYVDNVIVDNENGAYQGVAHLIDLGHQNIGFVGHPPNITTGAERKNGYLQALIDHGLPVQDKYICEGDAKIKGGFICSQQLIKTNPEITALFVSNNLMTLGAIKAIRNLGLKIPDEISIVGFDDMPWAPYLDPPLTAIAQPTYELGKKSAELLIQRIQDPHRKAKRVQLKTSLIIRSSTKPPIAR